VARQGLEEVTAVPGVEPATLHVAVVIAAGACGQPDLLQRRLQIDDDAAVVGEHQFQQPAGTVRVDVDHVILQPAVGGRFDAGQHLATEALVVGIAQGRSGRALGHGR
jgi:hypothetical protein